MTLGVVVSAMAGQNLSLGQYGRVKQIFKTVTMIALLIGALSCLFIFLWPHLIASLFTTNAVVSGYAVQYFRIVCFSYIAMALLSALQGVVRGAGDTVMMLALSVIALILVRVPLAYGLSQTAWRERGVWLAILVSSVAGVLFSYLYYLSGRWKRIKVLPASATGADIEEPGPT
jgi:Na+-driven multidrug efflux pump